MPACFRDAISSGAKPQSTSAVSVSAPAATGARRTSLGVRSKRGAGAGWGAPSTSTNVVARDVVRMRARLAHREHRREADLGAREELDPLVARARREQRGEALLQRGPLRWSICCAGSRSSSSSEARAGWRRTSARTTRSTRTRRRRSRTRCRSARRRRAGSCPRSPQPSIASRPKKMLISCALPSTIAASTTWPCAATSPARRARRGCRSRRARRRRRSRRAG